jgi:diacylglycerol O-acyltransferase-1
VPVCQDSVVYFENRDYVGILIATLSVGIPGSYAWLIMFFGIFHAMANFSAEITRFSDRRFYSDWWNAGGLAEYWRKWNYPIHNWLVRHCYYPMVRRGIRSDVARFLTFTVSALFHEYIFVGTFRIFNMIAFTFMIVNVPLMQIQKVFKNQFSKEYNNILFWLFYTILG